MEIPVETLLSNITFKTSRSGGKGGQNVNKVASKVELNFNLEESVLLAEEQKERIKQKLTNRIISGNIIQVICEEERSQMQNKQRCVEKLIVLLKNALHQPKARKATKPKKSAIENRLKGKQIQAMKKLNRRKDLF